MEADKHIKNSEGAIFTVHQSNFSVNSLGLKVDINRADTPFRLLVQLGMGNGKDWYHQTEILKICDPEDVGSYAAQELCLDSVLSFYS